MQFIKSNLFLENIIWLTNDFKIVAKPIENKVRQLKHYIGVNKIKNSEQFEGCEYQLKICRGMFYGFFDHDVRNLIVNLKFHKNVDVLICLTVKGFVKRGFT